MKTYTATIDGDRVSICVNGVWATAGRLDGACLERGEAHILDADAPLGDDVYEDLDDALTEALRRGETEATVEYK